jgi:ribonuclease HI
VDYGLIVYGAASASSIEKIDIALRSIMRLILGAFKSTPAATLYAELGLEPTADRRMWLAAKYVLNLSNKPSNAAYPSALSVMYGGYVWKPRSIPCLNLPMQQLLAEGWSGFELEPEYVSLPNAIKPPAPWASLPFSIKFFPWSKEKAVANRLEARCKIQEWTDSFPQSTVFFYTDGSVCSASQQASCAFFSPDPPVERAWSLSAGSSIYSAEVTAIEQVLSYVFNLEETTDEICIFTDSKSAVQAISASTANPVSPPCLRARNLASCLKSSGTKITLAWIPSHIGVPGNEKADQLASVERQSPSGKKVENLLSASESASRFKKVWQSSVLISLQQECLKDTVQCRESLGVLSWQFDKSRQNSVALHRIRSGHNLLNRYQFRLDEGADPSCRFGCEKLEDAEHLLLRCPELNNHGRNLLLFFNSNNIDLNLETITGCNPNLDRNTQFKIRDKLISFIKIARIRHLIYSSVILMPKMCMRCSAQSVFSHQSLFYHHILHLHQPKKVKTNSV